MPTRYTLKFGLMGLVLAGLTALFISFLPELAGRIVLAVILSAASGIYLKYAFIRREPALVIVELVFLTLFVTMALVGVAVSRMYLALGFLFHGFWDLAHHPRYIRTSGPAWYQPMCLAFDWGIVIFIVARH
jgi:hypothetical protein